MKNQLSRPGKPGFVSYLVVLSVASVLTVLMISAYRAAIRAQGDQAVVQLQLDYAEKEDAIMRSVVAITPNRAIRAMQHNSNKDTTISEPLRWQNIFTEAMGQANARAAIPANVQSTLNIPNLRMANTGNSALSNPAAIFKALDGETGFVTPGIDRSFGSGFPPPLTTTSMTISDRDKIYPIIADAKQYGTLAQPFLSHKRLNGNDTAPYGVNMEELFPNEKDGRRRFNRLRYPNINFGYLTPGQPFVAKRNWWAFSVNLADHDRDSTQLTRPARRMVLSIYEIPSQLAISASAFISLGQLASGEAWQSGNVKIDGGVYASKASMVGNTAISAIASRRGMTMSSGSTVGGESFTHSPFTPGVREAYQLTEGEFFPVSQSSESGRVAFVPINRGAEFFDRYHPNVRDTENQVISTTTWNTYSVGAMQCAMWLDVTKTTDTGDMNPTELKFYYMKGGVRMTQVVSTVDNNAHSPALPSGYDVSNLPFESTKIESINKPCIAVYPMRFKAFLAALGADGTDVNHSLAVNVDYTNIGLGYPVAPRIPCTDELGQYGVILKECADLTSFTKGFSLVTNLRTYIGDDFNNVLFKDGASPVAPPTGYSGTADTYYPACSMFCPERRYGVEVDPYAINVSGQIGSLAAEDSANPVRPIDSKTARETNLTASQIKVNLRPISHPADLPPITMMNWLVVLEERRGLGQAGY